MFFTLNRTLLFFPKMTEPNPNPTDSPSPTDPSASPSDNELLPYDDIVQDILDDDDDDDEDDDEEDNDEDEEDMDDEDMISLGSQDTDPNRPGTGSRPSRSRKRVRLDDYIGPSNPAGRPSKKEYEFTSVTAFIDKIDMNGNKMWLVIRGRVDGQQFDCRGTTVFVGSQFKFIFPWVVYAVDVIMQPTVRKGPDGSFKPVFDKPESQLNVLAVILFDRPQLSRSYVLDMIKKSSPEILRDPHSYDVYRTQKTACEIRTLENRADFAFMGAQALGRTAHELFGNLLRVPAYYYLYYALGQEYLDSKTDREISDIWAALQHVDSRRDMFFSLTTLGYFDVNASAAIAISDLFAESITDHERMLARLWRTHIRQPWITERRLKWPYSPEMQPLEREGLIARTTCGNVVPRSLYTLMRGSILTTDIESVVHRWTYVACANVTMARKLIIQNYNARGKEMHGNTDICVMDARDHLRMTPEPHKKMIMVWRAHELSPSDFFTLARVLHTSQADIFLCGQALPMAPSPDFASGEPKTDAERRRLDLHIMNWFRFAFERAPVAQRISSLQEDIFFSAHSHPPSQSQSQSQSRTHTHMSAGEMVSRVERAVRRNDGTLILCRNDELCIWLRAQIDSRFGAAQAQRISQGDWIIGAQGEQQRVQIIWKAAGGTMFTEVPNMRVSPFPSEFVIAYNRTARDEARIPWGVSSRMRKYLIASLEGNGFTPVSSNPTAPDEEKRLIYVTNAEMIESWEVALLSALVPAASSLSLSIDVLMYRDTQRGSEPHSPLIDQNTLMNALDVELATEISFSF